MMKVNQLTKHYPLHGGFLKQEKGVVQAVSGVTLEILRGETVGLVGESGCGKSTLGRAMVALEEPTSGEVLFEGQDLFKLKKSELRSFRKNIQMIFQDPFSSLNPKMTVFDLLAEPIRNFEATSWSLNSKKIPSTLESRVKKIMEDVGLLWSYRTRWPHEFSGGQRQRISIGRALACQPKLIICDEPVSALDVSIQGQILNLLVDLQKKYQISYLFISHDLHVVQYLSHKVAVMYLGRIVEIGPTEEIFSNPRHPYTQVLLAAAPILRTSKTKTSPLTKGADGTDVFSAALTPPLLEGDIPSPIHPPSGCAFHPRCPKAQAECRLQVLPLKPVHETTQASKVACLLYSTSGSTNNSNSSNNLLTQGGN